MIFEEYCSYILSREKEIKEFTIPGSEITFDKEELLSSLRKVLRDDGSNDIDYDDLLMKSLQYYVDKDYLEKIHKFDESMNAILSNIRKRFEQIVTIYKSMERGIPFSYEKVFEILVYYLRLVTNILDADKEPMAHYHTAIISPDAVAHFFSNRTSLKSLSEEWEKKGWNLFYKDLNPFFINRVDSYMRFVLLSTYIRYCEIMDN